MQLALRGYNRRSRSISEPQEVESYPFRGHSIKELMPVPIVVATLGPITDRLSGSDTFRPRLTCLTSHANGVTILHGHR
jgi:hypothetical protein